MLSKPRFNGNSLGTSGSGTPKYESNIVENDIKSGDLIIHEKYGKGVVMNIDGSIATIAFSGAGVKKLLKNHKSIKKVSN